MTRSVAIDSIRLELGDMRGHEHRIEPIVRRAAELVAERLGERWPEAGVGAVRSIARVAIAPRGVDLRTLTDEEAAHAISTPLADAVLRRLQ